MKRKKATINIYGGGRVSTLFVEKAHPTLLLILRALSSESLKLHLQDNSCPYLTVEDIKDDCS